MNEKRWKTYVTRSKQQVLDKVRSVFFFEWMEDQEVLRSRQCKFYVRNPIRNDDVGAVDYVRCEECSTLNRKREKVTLFSYRKDPSLKFDPGYAY